MGTTDNVIENRLKNLEKHLEQENPVLLNAVRSFRRLDDVAHRIGFLERTESFATQIPWWPLISVLGTFSAGKSTFINNYLDTNLQRSGNQAVDDKFTVICYSKEKTAHALPGIALDSDPRFPFYQISREIEQVAAGEGRRIDAYLQLKSCPCDRLRGKILIDSPGFDADAQRNSTLRITDYIIDLSDLVLVFFDARHPEPGAMRDTLEHLVANTIKRPDSGKFLFILNQIDTTAREDNPEEVIAAWQRAMGEHGLTAGRFYSIYNPDAAVPIQNESLRARFESKRDTDLDEIHNRMNEVEIERAYRIVGTLEKTVQDIRGKLVPTLTEASRRWRRRVLWADVFLFGALVAITAYTSFQTGFWKILEFPPSMPTAFTVEHLLTLLGLLLVLALIMGLHHLVRALAARSVDSYLHAKTQEYKLRGNLVRAFRRNTRFWRSIYSRTPVGWNRGSRKRVDKVVAEINEYIQTLNDRFTNPSGDTGNGNPDPASASFPNSEGTVNEEAVRERSRSTT